MPESKYAHPPSTFIHSRHNNRVMRSYNERNVPPPPQCNCAIKPNCPLNGRCQAESIVYRADIMATGQEPKYYIGASSGRFKLRYGNHKKSLAHERYKQETALSIYAWEMKDKGATININWSIVRKVPTCKPGDKGCSLCLAEKLAIFNSSKDPHCLNKRTELFSKCRHRRRNLLCSVRK